MRQDVGQQAARHIARVASLDGGVGGAAEVLALAALMWGTAPGFLARSATAESRLAARIDDGHLQPKRLGAVSLRRRTCSEGFRSPPSLLFASRTRKASRLPRPRRSTAASCPSFYRRREACRWQQIQEDRIV